MRMIDQLGNAVGKSVVERGKKAPAAFVMTAKRWDMIRVSLEPTMQMTIDIFAPQLMGIKVLLSQNVPDDRVMLFDENDNIIGQVVFE